MTIDIHAALERLEKNLSQIQSAKEQVQQITSSSEQVCQIMERYAQAIDSMNVTISSLVQYMDQYTDLNIRELQEAVEKVHRGSEQYLDQFNQQQEDTVATFHKQTQSLLKDFKEQNKTLVEKTEQLEQVTRSFKSYNKLSNELNQQLQTLLTDLPNNQKELGLNLSEILQCVSNQSSLIERCTQETNQCRSKQNHALNDELNRASKQTEAIQSALNEQQKQLITQKEAFLGAQQRLMWIIIIGFAVLAALRFL